MTKILCVDDEPSVLSSLRRLFLDEPWEVHTATGGEEGLQLISQHAMDLVLADFRMPGMDGVEFLKRVRQQHPDCIRVVLSGFADIALIVSALNEGQIYKFIAKPWNGDQLVDTIRKLLEHQRVDREYRRLSAELRTLNAELSQRIRKLEKKTQGAVGYARLLHEALEHSRVPIIGVSPDGAIFLKSRGAESLVATPEFQDDLEAARGRATLPAVVELSVAGASVLVVFAPESPPPVPSSDDDLNA